MAVCLGLTMVIRLIPSAVLWGYFAFMALESLGGSQFWERLVYLMTDPAKRYRRVDLLGATLHFQSCSHQCLKLLPLQQLRICSRHLQQSDPSHLSLTSLSDTAASVPCTQN